MAIYLLQPPAANYWTGGYLYNQHIARSSQIEIITCHGAEISALACCQDSKQPLIVDSLFLYQNGFKEVWDRLPSAYILVHHLQSLDPTLAGKQQARFAKLEQEILASAQALIATSQHMASRLRSLYPDQQVFSCRPGIDKDLILKYRALRQDSLANKTHETIQLLSVAHLSARKGYLPAASLLHRLRMRFPQIAWQWSIIGSQTLDIEYSKAFLEQLKKLALDDRVRLVGLLEPEQVFREMAQADFLFFPSLFETFGMVVQEAISLGLPVIAHNQGEMPHLIRDRNMGLLIQLEEADLAVASISSLFQDKSWQSEMPRQLLLKPLPSWDEAASKLVNWLIEQKACKK